MLRFMDDVTDAQNKTEQTADEMVLLQNSPYTYRMSICSRYT